VVQARALVNGDEAPAATSPQGLSYVPYLAARDQCVAAATLLALSEVESWHDRLELTVSPGAVVFAQRAAFRPLVFDRETGEIDTGATWASKPTLTAQRGVIDSWSDRSRRRMVLAIAQREWAGTGWAMLTTTYPGDWLGACPDPSTAKRHLQALRRRWQRAWGTPECFWKLEFQARGAPHFHILGRLPQNVELRVFRAWLSRCWYEIVGSGDERHLRAGTRVDAQWREWDSPATVGFYFSKHGTWSTKQYQHDVPTEWETTGRWWGSWNLPRIAETVDIDPAQIVQLRRVLRRWFRSVHKPRLIAVRQEHHQGVLVLRESWKKPRLRSLHSRRGGAALLAKDGPRLANALAVALGYVNQGAPHAALQA
jgi:hypothetical protein